MIQVAFSFVANKHVRYIVHSIQHSDGRFEDAVIPFSSAHTEFMDHITSVLTRLEEDIPDSYIEVSILQPTARRLFMKNNPFRFCYFLSREEVSLKRSVCCHVNEKIEELSQTPEKAPKPKPVKVVAPITVATDGSVHAQFGGGSYAWVDSNGDYSMQATSKYRQVIACELAAILYGIKGHSGNQPLVILTDSKAAIELINTPRKTALKNKNMFPSLVRLLDSIREQLVSRQNVEIRWVKGHDGHALNEAADRLCRQVRLARSFQHDDHEEIKNIADNIVKDAMRSYQEN